MGQLYREKMQGAENSKIIISIDVGEQIHCMGSTSDLVEVCNKHTCTYALHTKIITITEM